MTRQEIFTAVKKNIMEILPDLAEEVITIEGSLRDMGANSIGRADIVAQTLEDLELQIPLLELGKAKNLQDLVDILYEKQ